MMEYKKGNIVEGKIIHIDENYLLVNFPNNITGILHKSKIYPTLDGILIDYYKQNQSILVSIDMITDKGYTLGCQNIKKRFAIQQENEAKELEKKKIKEEKERMRQLVTNYADKFERESVYEAIVVKLSYQNAKISVNGIEGYIDKDELNWNETESIKETLFEGESINVVFLEYKEDKLYFGLKYFEKEPYDEKLYDLNIDNLLDYAGHSGHSFIGEAKKHGRYTFIENLYSDNENQKGKLLVDPIYGYNLKAITNENAEENHFYKINLQLVSKEKRVERNQLFQFIATNIEQSENPYKRDVDLTFQKLISPTANKGLAHLLAEVGKNMLSSKDRMFFELVQNADDSASEKGVNIDVKTDGDYFAFCHNGNSFDKNDFCAITSSANGTKKANENKIGYKGIGFKTVFTDSKQVFIKTSGYQFKFDKNDDRFCDFDNFYFTVNRLKTDKEQQDFLQKFCKEKSEFQGVKDIPWQLEPIWIDQYPNELNEKFTKSNVSIALKLGYNKINGENGYKKAIEEIIANPKFMLFLHNTNRICFNGKYIRKSVKDEIITIKNSFNNEKIEYFKKEDFELKFSNEIFKENGIGISIKVEEQDYSGKIIEAKFVDLHNEEFENIPKKIAINHSTTITFAIPIDENGRFVPNTNKSDISIFAFLPTMVKEFFFSTYVNANFLLTSDREHILGDNPWNFYLMQEIGRKLVILSARLSEKEDYKALEVLPEFFIFGTSDVKQLAEHFNSAYKSALETEAFILNQSGNLSKQEEIIIDKTGLSEIVGQQLFCEIIGTNKQLPSDKIDSSILSKKIFELIEPIKLSEISDQLVDNELLNSWYISATAEEKDKLCDWLIKNREECQKVINALPIFKFGKENLSRNYIDKNQDYIITTEHIVPIKEILSKLGFKCSDELFEKHLLKEYIEVRDEKDLFDDIVKRLNNKDLFDDIVKRLNNIELLTQEKLTLIQSLSAFENVGEKSLAGICLFCNIKGEKTPLSEMLPYKDSIPDWLKSYVICKEENFEELKKYLVEDEFSVAWEHFDDLGITANELYNTYKWTDSNYTRELINKYKGTKGIENILNIVDGADKDTKKYYLDAIDKIELISTAKYKNDSFEFRVLQIALSVFENPSDFSSKIYYEGECIKNFSVKDEVTCEFDEDGRTKKVKMSLAKLLPQYQNQSDSIEKIKSLFESKEDLDKFFDAKEKPIDKVYSELNTLLKIHDHKSDTWQTKAGNAYQYLFSVNIRKLKWERLFGFQIQLKDEDDTFINELMDFLFNNNVNIKYSSFTYHIHNFFEGKYFNNDFILEEEMLLPKIENWVDKDKKKIDYLSHNGVKTRNDESIRFRELFIKNEPINFLYKLSEKDISSGLKFIATKEGFEKPFNGDNQKQILLELLDRKGTRPISKFDSKIDIDKLNNNSTEWDTTEYFKWIQDHKLRINQFSGLMPRNIIYDNVLLMQYNEGNYYYDRQSMRLFVSQTQNIENVLEAANDRQVEIFTIDDYIFLCMEGRVSIPKEEFDELKDKDKSLQRYIKEYGNLKDEEVSDNSNSKQEITENDNITVNIAKGNNSPLSKDKQFDAQIEAQKFLMRKIPGWTYPENYGSCSEENGKPCYYSTVEIKDEAGNNIPIVLKSYKYQNEPFKVNTTEWNWIKEGAKLLIYNGKDIKEIDYKDLVRNQANVSITFSTENLDIEDRIDAFADTLHYFKELHFDFNSFNISENADSIRNIYNQTEGVQDLLDDNDI